MTRNHKFKVLSRIDVATALDSIVSKTIVAAKPLAAIGHACMGWCTEAARLEDEAIFTKDLEAGHLQREQIDKFITEHIEQDRGSLRNPTLVAVDIAASFWAADGLWSMAMDIEAAGNYYDMVYSSLASGGYGNAETLLPVRETHQKLQTKTGQAIEHIKQLQAALKAYSLTCPATLCVLIRLRAAFSSMQAVRSALTELHSTHHTVVNNSYHQRHRTAAQQRFDMA